MMTTQQETNVKQLPAFSTLSVAEQCAIQMRAGHLPYAAINRVLRGRFGLEVADSTVRQWFMHGGRLEQAYLEYVGALADLSLKEARIRVKRATIIAAEVMEDLLDKRNVPSIRFNAAKTIMAKYLPDRQIILDPSQEDPELPIELGDEADAIISGADDHPNDPSEGPGASGEDRPTGDEALPAELLSEPASSDGPGDPPA